MHSWRNSGPKFVKFVSQTIDALGSGRNPGDSSAICLRAQAWILGGTLPGSCLTAGHAYLSPPPRFFFGRDGRPAPRKIRRSAPCGRIGFANTDLAGALDHRYSILEAQRCRSIFFQILT